MRPTARLLFLALATTLAACQSTATRPDTDLRINEFHQVLSAEDRERWLNERWNYLRSFYQQNEEPYFGKSTVDEGCEQRAVDQVEVQETSRYILKSARVRTNEAGFSGICKSEDQTHRMRLVFLVCKDPPRQFDLKKVCAGEECQISQSSFETLCVRGKGD